MPEAWTPHAATAPREALIKSLRAAFGGEAIPGDASVLRASR
jgi:hypothetical protein